MTGRNGIPRPTKALLLLSLVVFWGLASAEGNRPEAAEKRLKVAFVFDGPVGDAGYTLAHDLGRRYLAKNVPDVETAYSEKVNIPDAERIILSYVRRGYGLIFTTTFGFMDPTLAVAKKFPNVIFMNASGFKLHTNMGNYWAREYQARYLTGLVAGRMTKSNIIGFVAAHSIPPVVRGINSFARGVWEVNPRAQIRVIFTQTWYDPAKEGEATESLFDVGADLIAQHQDSPAPVQVAERRGKYAIGYNWDMSRFGPNAHLTAAIFQWGPFYAEMAKQVLAGTWKSQSHFWGLSKGAVDIAPFHSDVPENIRNLVEKRKKDVASGAFAVFQGPIKDQTGKIRVAEGKKAPDEHLLSMDYLIEGVRGTLPK